MPGNDDVQPIAVDPQFGVGVPARQEVIFKDGSALWLHRVGDTVPDLFQRRVELANGEYARVDLRRLAPELAADLPVAESRDVPGLVHWSLRLLFGSAQAFKARAAELHEAEQPA